MATSTDIAQIPVAPIAAAGNAAPVIRNVAFGILDYLAQPLLMLLTARYFVHQLGITMFGVWMLVLAIVGSSGTLSTGFGDAALKYISTMRGRFDPVGVRSVLRAAFTLNLTLGLALSIVIFAIAPWAATHIFHIGPQVSRIFVPAVRLGGCVLVVRSLSFVFTGTLKAFENYQTATELTVFARIAIVGSAFILVSNGRGVVEILLATLLCEIASLFALAIAVRQIVGPLFSIKQRGSSRWRALISFGSYGWLQALSGTLFSQADRLLVATFLGPAALGYYGLCVQCSQPIHGLSAAGSSVFFPHLSARVERDGVASIRQTVSRTIWVNALCLLAVSAPLLIFSRQILNLWMGAAFSANAATTLALVSLSFVFLGFNIPGHYALMALGKIRFLTAINLCGCAVSLLIAILLIPRLGIAGAAIGRLCYGPITWLLYPKLHRELHAGVLRDSISV